MAKQKSLLRLKMERIETEVREVSSLAENITVVNTGLLDLELSKILESLLTLDDWLQEYEEKLNLPETGEG